MSQKSNPSGHFVAVSTDTDLTRTYGHPPRGLYVGVTGDVELRRLDGTDVVFTGVPAGVVLPVEFAQVRSANTTATNMVALY